MECRLNRLLLTEEHVNHINFDKLDNSLQNLEIVTHSENTAHYWANQVVDTTDICFKDVHKSGSGEKNPMSKLTDEMAKSLILELLEGMSNSEAGEKYGLHPRYVSLIRHKKRWKSAWKDLALETSTTRVSNS